VSTTTQFRTFQTSQNYEDALSRHGQWLRWISGLDCPCLNPISAQPDPQCYLCKGRGRIYKSPGHFEMLNEIVKHDRVGRVYPSYRPYVVGTASVYHGDTLLSLGTQPSDYSYIQLGSPFPKEWERLIANYEWNPEIEIVGEDSEVLSGTTTLRTIAPRFSEKGKDFEGSIKIVSKVYNSTKEIEYVVASFHKEYIYLDSMDSWEIGDVLSVDYIYLKPFNFLLSGISPRMRYEQPYVLDEADAILITPYWAQIAPNDLLTAMAIEQIGNAIINPTITPGNDVISAYYDLSRLLRVIDKNGTEYSVGPGKNVEIFERNELKWNITKPSVMFSVQFTYHPTYTALTNMHSLRNAENKAFVNRISVKQYDRINERIEY
jgi:hypothetical protein